MLRHQRGSQARVRICVRVVPRTVPVRRFTYPSLNPSPIVDPPVPPIKDITFAPKALEASLTHCMIFCSDCLFCPLMKIASPEFSCIQDLDRLSSCLKYLSRGMVQAVSCRASVRCSTLTPYPCPKPNLKPYWYHHVG